MLTVTPPTPHPAHTQVTLMQENGDTREDLTLPKGTDEAEKLAESIKEQFAGGQELVVSVLKAMGEEMINSVKIINN
jgi:translation initiation factor 5A